MSFQNTYSSSDLPDVFIGTVSAIPVLSVYRRILANVLMGPSQDHSYSARYEPALALVPQLVEHGDFMKHLCYLWRKRLGAMRSVDKVQI